MKLTREYASPLRAEQRLQTRNRILEAFAEQVVDGGLQELSIERVAQRAGVSTRTVYDHFPKRDDLLDAIADWIEARYSADPITAPLTGEEFARRLEHVFQIFDDNETIIRAQLLTQIGRAVRERGRARRRPVIEEIVREAAPNVTPDEIQRAAAIIHYLVSSEAWRSLKDESGLDGHEAGQAVGWAVRALLNDLKRSGAPHREHEKGEDDGDR